MKKQSQGGFSLAELMVALVVGLILSGSVLAFTMSSFKSNSDYVRSTRLTQELRNSMDLVTRELRRAGYDQDALKYLARGVGSPFSRMFFGAANADGSFSCVIYAYDREGGTSGTIEQANKEVRAIRWAQRNVGNRSNIGVLEYAESWNGGQPTCGGAAPDYSTNPASCSAGGWCPMSDGTVVDITRFALTDHRSLVGTAPQQVQLRDVDVAIVGQLAGSTEFTRGMQSSVRIRSECYDVQMSNCSVAPAP